MRSVSYGLLIAMIIALNITTSIIAGLGETIASVAAGLVDGAGEVGTAAGGVDVALPALAETGGIDQNIRVFQYMGSFLIVISIVILGLITARIRGRDYTGPWTDDPDDVGGRLANFFSAWILDQSVGLFQSGA